jgi:hypothetical protein
MTNNSKIKMSAQSSNNLNQTGNKNYLNKTSTDKDSKNLEEKRVKQLQQEVTEFFESGDHSSNRVNTQTTIGNFLITLEGIILPSLTSLNDSHT